jgi:hypothetical protein
MSKLQEDIENGEVNYHSEIENENRTYENFIEILREFINDEKRGKKAIISKSEFKFIVRANTINEYTQSKYSIPKLDDNGNIVKENGKIVYTYIARNRPLDFYCWQIIEHGVSIDGKMLDKIIAFFKPVSEHIVEQESINVLKINKNSGV